MTRFQREWIEDTQLLIDQNPGIDPNELCMTTMYSKADELKLRPYQLFEILKSIIKTNDQKRTKTV